MPGLDDNKQIMDNIYTSCSCNRTPHCLAYDHGSQTLAYGSCNALVLAKSDWLTPKTFARHTDRVNTVRFINSRCVLTGSTDKTAIVWHVKEGIAEALHVLKGHTSSVTVVTGSVLSDDSLLVVTAAGDNTVKIWSGGTDGLSCGQTIVMKNRGFALDLRLAKFQETAPVLFIGADDCKVQIWGSSEDKPEFHMVHALPGHSDWVQGIDLCRDPALPNDWLLVSSSHDGLIRVYRLSPRTEEEASREQRSAEQMDEIKVREEMFAIQGSFYAVSLETVLAGHEDKIFGVHFSPEGSDVPLSLLSCSMDKTLIIWRPETLNEQDDEEVETLWTEYARLGEVGGNTLGFLGCQWLTGPGDGKSRVAGFSFNGAFHEWAENGESDGLFEPQVPLGGGGHFEAVEDLGWEANGRYLLSLSKDQTTRCHGPWPSKAPNAWREIARPQVHGYDLACLAVMPGQKFASGAEEKIVRVFQGTKMFAENCKSITGQELSDSASLAQGASVPSLGLSNKAVLEGETVIPEGERHVKDQYPDYYFKPEVFAAPPPEESLVQNTLWPELQKLYGHGYEIFSVASSNDGHFLASACKAQKAEHAEILLWHCVLGTGGRTEWRIKEKLKGHTLTVTRMAFSPDASVLLSVSRDRTWAAYKLSKESNSSLITIAGKGCKGAHSRIIWDCAWSGDGQYFATCSRDKKVAVWQLKRASEDFVIDNVPDSLTLEDSVTAVSFSPKLNADHSYSVALGLDSGRIVLAKWRPDGTNSKWELVRTLEQSQSHHKTVKRLMFRPGQDSDQQILASCGGDHSVKLFLVRDQ